MPCLGFWVEKCKFRQGLEIGPIKQSTPNPVASNAGGGLRRGPGSREPHTTEARSSSRPLLACGAGDDGEIRVRFVSSVTCRAPPTPRHRPRAAAAATPRLRPRACRPWPSPPRHPSAAADANDAAAGLPRKTEEERELEEMWYEGIVQWHCGENLNLYLYLYLYYYKN
ncbi:hypothetical protein [Oryza sativa Japonica Group]|uniref:Uncharacterized protein n=2 Tax=Oryza sativa subsp. japonica TaxID=39947 RepID=Q5N908_ORYSJ|nr:hypothetical protein [Oryza sativa Japonica Group]